MDCSVCCQPTNASSSIRGRVTCHNCDFCVCRSCVQTYLLSILKNPQCMNCNQSWTYDYLENNLQRKFLNKPYNKHRENVLLQQEREHFNDSRLFIKYTLELKTIISKMDAAKVVLEALTVRKQQRLLYGLTSLKTQKRITRQKEEIHNIRQEKQIILQKRNTLEHTQIFYCFTNGCQNILDSSYHCSDCSKNWCITCYQECKKDEIHTCVHDDVRTVELLTNNVRQCPGCAMSIYKIDGCDQMFCVQCHIAFSWTKGTIVSGKIHNPHYYEHLRNSKGAIQRNDDNAENIIMNPDMIPFVNMSNAFKNACKYIKKERMDIEIAFCTMHKTFPMRKILRSYLRCIQTIHSFITILQVKQSNMDLRVSFLQQEIDEETIKRRLRKRENASRNKEIILAAIIIFQINFEMCVRKIWTSNSKYEIISTIDEINNVRKYTNEKFLSISQKRKIQVPYITNIFRILFRDYKNSSFTNMLTTNELIDI